LSGLAHEYQKECNDQYLAGIWRNELWRDLQWYIVPDEGRSPKRPFKYRAPTWSWASVEGHKYIIFQWIGGEKASYVEIIRAWTEPAGMDPLGSVKSGLVVVRGLLLKGCHRRDEEADANAPSCSAYAFYISRGNLGEEKLDSILGDTSLDDLPNGGEEEVSLLYLSAMFGLILRLVPGTKVTYKRIGTINISQRFAVANLNQMSLVTDSCVMNLI
jgi:hypothetical protein